MISGVSDRRRFPSSRKLSSLATAERFHHIVNERLQHVAGAEPSASNGMDDETIRLALKS
jgi:hypothetical protein